MTQAYLHLLFPFQWTHGNLNAIYVWKWLCFCAAILIELVVPLTLVRFWIDLLSFLGVLSWWLLFHESNCSWLLWQHRMRQRRACRLLYRWCQSDFCGTLYRFLFLGCHGFSIFLSKHHLCSAGLFGFICSLLSHYLYLEAPFSHYMWYTYRHSYLPLWCWLAFCSSCSSLLSVKLISLLMVFNFI